MTNKNKELQGIIIEEILNQKGSRVSCDDCVIIAKKVTERFDSISTQPPKAESVDLEDIITHFSSILARVKRPEKSIHGGTMDKGYDEALLWFKELQSPIKLMSSMKCKHNNLEITAESEYVKCLDCKEIIHQKVVNNEQRETIK